MFDTLVARRCVHPFTDEADPQVEREANELIPIRENVAQVEPGDVVVSDMYLDREWLSYRLTAVTGLVNDLYVSRDGKATGRVWGQLPSRPELHTGDHPVTDVQSATAAGIPARQVGQWRPTAVEQGYIDRGLVGLGRCAREARLGTWNPEHRDHELAQTQANFPLLMLATVALERWAKGHGLRKVLLCGRDGWLWHQVAQRMTWLETEYFPTSRVARTLGSDRYLAFTQSKLEPGVGIADLCGTGWSLRRLLNRIGSSAPHFVLSRYGGPLAEEYESVVQTTGTTDHLISEASEYLENANLAPTPMVVDMDNDGPVYMESGMNWQGSPEIRAAHGALRYCVDAVGIYSWDSLWALSDRDLAEEAKAAVHELGRYDALMFLRETKRAEEAGIRELLARAGTR
jgi:hypothetical protein